MKDLYRHKITKKVFLLIKKGKKVSVFFNYPRCKTTVNGWVKHGIDKKSIIKNCNIEKMNQVQGNLFLC